MVRSRRIGPRRGARLDRGRQLRGLGGCLLYGIGGLALVWSLRLLVVVQQCETALEEGREAVAIRVYDDHGDVVASRDVLVSEEAVREDRTIALGVGAGAAAALAAGFVLRGPPWRRDRSIPAPVS